ncbi:MAG: hypothetical protein Q4A55_02565 [Aerococcus sp.]|nr:hypothetical protein [Aerococcus sp.]
MSLCCSNEGLEILRTLKGHFLIKITADDWRDYDRSYGSIKMNLDELAVAIENDYRNVFYFGSREELAGYDIVRLTNRDFDPSVMKSDLYVKAINQKISSIQVIRDTIILNYFREKPREKYVIDQGLIFTLDNMKWTVSQTSLFTPMSQMIFTDKENGPIKSIAEVKADWEDDDLNGEDDRPTYTVEVERNVLDL